MNEWMNEWMNEYDQFRVLLSWKTDPKARTQNGRNTKRALMLVHVKARKGLALLSKLRLCLQCNYSKMYSKYQNNWNRAGRSNLCIKLPIKYTVKLWQLCDCAGLQLHNKRAGVTLSICDLDTSINQIIL